MLQALQTAASGLSAQQARLDTVAADIANVNTVGYKAQRAEFKDALYTRMDSPISDPEGSNLHGGTGVLLSSTERDFSDGAAQDTGAELDFCISGNGFFTLKDPMGEQVYTRNGNFTLSEENGNSYLVNADGYFVLSDVGQRISFPSGSAVSVADDGTLSSGGKKIAKLGIADFDNTSGLLEGGSTCFQVSAASGTPYAAQNAKIEQGKLETSNVNLGEELTLLMRSQRAYSFASKALQTADEMEGLANNMR